LLEGGIGSLGVGFSHVSSQDRTIHRNEQARQSATKVERFFEHYNELGRYLQHRDRSGRHFIYTQTRLASKTRDVSKQPPSHPPASPRDGSSTILPDSIEGLGSSHTGQRLAAICSGTNILTRETLWDVTP
jgi:hypothetical protein